MTSGAIHVAQVPESGWPCPLPPPLGCNLSANRKRKPKWRRCVAASIAVGPSAIRTGSRTRPSDWGSNARFSPMEDRRNNRRLAPFTCTPCVLQIWWLSPLSAPSSQHAFFILLLSYILPFLSIITFTFHLATPYFITILYQYSLIQSSLTTRPPPHRLSGSRGLSPTHRPLRGGRLPGSGRATRHRRTLFTPAPSL